MRNDGKIGGDFKVTRLILSAQIVGHLDEMGSILVRLSTRLLHGVLEDQVAIQLLDRLDVDAGSERLRVGTIGFGTAHQTPVTDGAARIPSFGRDVILRRSSDRDGVVFDHP